MRPPFYKILVCFLLLAFWTSCADGKKRSTNLENNKQQPAELLKVNFDTIIRNQKTGLFYIKNKDIVAACTNYGYQDSWRGSQIKMVK